MSLYIENKGGFMNINRKQIMETFIETIADVANKEYQDRVWIKGLGPECDDYSEFINYFLDESEAILASYKDFNITDTQYILLKKFEEKIRSFHNNPDRPYLPEIFLNSSEWLQIIDMAREVLVAFNYYKMQKDTLGK